MRYNHYEPGSVAFPVCGRPEFPGVTALAGLGAYLELWQAAGLGESVRRHLGVNQGRQG